MTPPELGRTADVIFEKGLDDAVVSGEGEHVVLFAHGAFLEPGANATGTTALFSRTPTGWTMQSATTPGEAGEKPFRLELLSPDFSLVALDSHSGLNTLPYAPNGIFEAGPFGGPYTTVASVPKEGLGAFQTRLLGANAGTSSVPAFSDVVLESWDHALLSPGPERERAEEMMTDQYDLYEWSGGGGCGAMGSSCRLVNVDDEGKLLNRCGAELGNGENSGDSLNAISADGSKVFFISPITAYPSAEPPSCGSEPQLYMRADGRETVNISEPEGVSIPLDERGEVKYVGANADGSKVFFTTASGLTPGAVGGYKLYEYDTEAPEGHRLTLIASEVAEPREFINPDVLVSEDGAEVYYKGHGPVPGDEAVYQSGIFRYETATGQKRFVSTSPETPTEGEPFYTTPNGDFLVFGAQANPVHPVEFFGPHGFEVEMRGYGHNELYRYDAATGGVICISCGEGIAPAKGEALMPESVYGLLTTSDSPAAAVLISEDGRRAFFQTSARLVPQDGNESTVEEEFIERLGKGADVYEWEEDGAEEAPGVHCVVANGCTHLISAGEDVGPERFLGGSTNGENVFFTSAAQLMPQATPEFTNIYDARVDGGFPSPAPTPECTSCQGVGSSQLPLNTPASETLVGADNLTVTVTSNTPTLQKATVRCARGRKLSHGKCARMKSKRRTNAKKAGGDRRGR